MNERKRMIFWLVIGWGLVSLACNLPLAEPPEPIVPPTAVILPTDEPTIDVAPTATLQPPTGVPEPTETPEPTVTPEPTATPILAPTATPFGAIDPNGLALDYVINWEFDTDRNFAWANVTLTAKGGNGEYLFYRDDKLTAGTGSPVFRFRWRSCQQAVGVFRVDSGEASTTVEFASQSPCG